MVQPDDIKQYHRSKLLLSFSESIVFIGYALAWLTVETSSWLAGWETRWAGLLAFAALFALGYELLTLPLAYYREFVLEHRYQLSNQTLKRWLSQTLKGWAAGGVMGGLVLAGFYALLWSGGDYWWLWVWLGWLGLTVILAKFFPILLLPLFYKSTPLSDASLLVRLARLAEGTTIRLNGIFSLELSADTKAANAMLTGLGNTRRVYLSDTLLQSFTPEEIEVVFAHELGHHTRHHLWKSLLLAAAVGTVYVAVMVWLLAPLRAAADWPTAVAALPQMALLFTGLGLIIQPIHHAVSRHFERQCDRDALYRTGNADAYRTAFSRLGEMNLADPNPHPLIEWYFYDHPAMSKRMALADAPIAG